VNLRQHDIGQDLPSPSRVRLDDRGGGPVACGLDSEYQAWGLITRSHDNPEAVAQSSASIILRLGNARSRSRLPSHMVRQALAKAHGFES